MMNITLTFDGGAAPNPGKGYGSYLVEGDAGFKLEGSRVQFGEPLTSNQAEWLSLISALKRTLVALKGDHYGTSLDTTPFGCRLLICSDSRLVLWQLTRRYKCKVAHLLELRQKADDLLAEFGGWQTQWHPREKSVALFGH